MTTESEFDVNSPITIFMLVVLAAFASFMLLTAPVLVGAFIKELHLSPQQAGYIISADLGGMGLAAIPAMFWLNRISWRKVACVSLLLNAVFHVISAGADSFGSLLAVRFVAGLFAGSAMSVCLASVGLTAQKNRNFGFWVVGQLVLGALGLAFAPHLVTLWGVKSIFLIAAACVTVLALFVRFLPQGSFAKNSAKESNQVGLSRHSLVLCILGLLAIYTFYIGLNGVWTYLERVGDAAGIEAGAIGYYLSMASIAGIGGALSASVLGDLWGRRLPVTLGYIIIFIALALLLNAMPQLRYLVAVCLFKYAWTFILPFALAALSNLDSSGRVIVITNIFIGGGLASGPAIAALLIGPGSYTPVIWFGLSAMLGSFLLLLPLVSRTEPDSVDVRAREPA